MCASPVPQLVSIQVALPAVHGQVGATDPLERPWRTGFYKMPVAGPVRVGRTNLVGDGQANLRLHGGPDKAVLGYAAGHYPLWRTELDVPDLPYGAFAENFTITLLDENTVCLGDVYAIGSSRFEVTQPRLPCANITRRWQRPGLTELVEQTGRHGWYMRVLETGEVEAGQPLLLVERPYPDWTVARAFVAMRRRLENPAEAQALLGVRSLSAAWRERLSGS